MLKQMPEQQRKALLVEAGVVGKTPCEGRALALKADLHMPSAEKVEDIAGSVRPISEIRTDNASAEQKVL